MSVFMNPATVKYSVKADNSLKEIAYEGLIIKNGAQGKSPWIVVLSGTSTQLADIEYFMGFLIEKGFSIASIERFIGNIFNIRMNPKIERKESLKHFIAQLTEHHGVQRLSFIAHSYASFEVIRLLIDNPEKYQSCVESIIFINPAGFNDHIKYVSHCFRFTFIFIMKEYVRIFFHLFKTDRKQGDAKDFFSKKARAINSLFLKTLRNPVKTFKEVYDIVSFKITPHMETLIRRYGYNFFVVLNTEDELVPVSDTVEKVKQMLPEDRIIRFSGNHMDLLINKPHIQKFLQILDATGKN